MEPVTLYLSADDSNSMASPVIARRELQRGSLPDPGLIRTYEFLNYYNVAYPAPVEGRANVVPELREISAGAQHVMQIGVQSAPLSPQPRSKVLTLVLDTSGSMGGAPIELEREVVRAIAASLRAGDIVSFVEWNTVRTVPLEAHVVSGPDDPVVLAAADRIEAGGGTDLHGGLTHGYELATRHYDPDKLNRVVLVSDGQANAGVTSMELIAAAAEDAETDGVYLVGVGVGEGYDDRLMDGVTDAGRGAYIFIDSAAEARRMFFDRFDEAMEIALMDVRVELTLPWYMDVVEFHGEEISTVASEVTPQHLAPGDAMIFHQELDTCDPTVFDLDDTVRVAATYVRPEGRVADLDAVEATLGELLAQPDIGLRRGDAIVAFAEALKKASYWSTSVESREAIEAAEAAIAAVEGASTDPALMEISELLGLLRARVGL